MPRRMGWFALAALALIGGCARTASPEATVVPAHGRIVAGRTPVVGCSTTYLVLATVSKCGDGGFSLGVAGE